MHKRVHFSRKKVHGMYIMVCVGMCTKNDDSVVAMSNINISCRKDIGNILRDYY